MKKLFILTLFGLMLSFSSFALFPITGTMHTCVGYSSYLSDSLSPGGVWSSSNTSIATMDVSGSAHGVSAGVCTITYTVGASYVTASFTVNPNPAAITGTAFLCVGTTTTLADATSGGTWSSFSTARATVSAAGVVTGVSSGTDYIYYTLPTGCSASLMVTVNTSALGTISGDSMICVGSTGTLTDPAPGGTWTSSNPAIATVGSTTGVVTGVSAGVASISYTIAGPCGPASTYVDVFISTGPSVDTISGPSSVVTGSTIPLSDGTPGGVWSSSNTAIATVSSGTVTGVSVGTVTISYSVTGLCGTAVATKVITVSAGAPVNRISGHVNFSGALVDSTSVVKVWLITYDTLTHLLEAVDSASSYGGGSTSYYQFLGEPTDSYRVKAAVYPAVFSPTGYMPTYHTSSSHWSSANVLHHTGGTDDGVDINMAWGADTAGPGFIAGDVTTGANRGSSGTIPAVGLLIYIVNSSGTITHQTYTDGSGHYSFGTLPLGTYTIYPEAINYATTPYASISLTTANPTMNAASFIQHTVSYTITPNTTCITNVATSASSVITFPNPASGVLNVLWNETIQENGNITISDITGREVYKTSITMNQGSGVKQIDLSELTNGLYIVTVKSGTINYNNKIQILH